MALATTRQNTIGFVDVPAPPRRRPQVWPGYLISQDEMRGVKRMLASALFDEDTCFRLVHERDPRLMAAFGLSYETQQWIRNMPAHSLDELASEIAHQL